MELEPMYPMPAGTLTLLPGDYEDSPQMTALCSCADNALAEFYTALNRVIGMAIPDGTDEKALCRWEQALGLSYVTQAAGDPRLTAAQRAQVLRQQLYCRTPFTLTALKRYLGLLCTRHTLTLDTTQPALSLWLLTETAALYREICRFLYRVLPANLHLTIIYGYATHNDLHRLPNENAGSMTHNQLRGES